MRLRLTAVLAALAVGPALAQVPERREIKPTEREARLEQIIQEFVQAQGQAEAAVRQARTEAERAAAEGLRPKEADFLPRVQQVVADGPTDQVAAEALTFAVIGLGTKDEGVTGALVKTFARTDMIRGFVTRSLGGAPDSAKPVLTAVLEHNPAADLKGLACFALGSMAQWKGTSGAAKEAEGYFARVEKEFGDVKGPRNLSLGDLAKANLFELRNLQVGMKAPAAESKTLGGEKVSLADYKGKVVVLDFWATWCGPCKAMIPHERELVRRLRDKPFALISVSVDDDRAELEGFLRAEPMPWAHWWEGGENGPLVRKWNVGIFPTVYVIDAKGVIRYKHVQGEELDKAVDKLLAEIKE